MITNTVAINRFTENPNFRSILTENIKGRHKLRIARAVAQTCAIMGGEVRHAGQGYGKGRISGLMLKVFFEREEMRNLLSSVSYISEQFRYPQPLVPYLSG